jgi:hypothetical protein
MGTIGGRMVGRTRTTRIKHNTKTQTNHKY